MEGLSTELDKHSIEVKWIGLPGKTLKRINPGLYKKVLCEVLLAFDQ